MTPGFNRTYIYVTLLTLFFFVMYYLWFKLYIEERPLKDNLKKENYKISDAKMKEREQISMIIQNLPIPFIVVNSKSDIVLYNQAMLEFASIKQKEIVSISMFDYTVAKFIKDNLIIAKMNEGLIWVDDEAYESSCIPIDDSHDNYLFVFQNITKSIEGEGLQKRFLADASHELKTPISVIKGMVEILNRDDFDDVELRVDFLQQIEKENLRLEHIVNELGELSKLSKRKPLLNRNQINITELLDSCIVSSSHLEQASNMTMIKEYAEISFFCDEEKIRQVIMNLLTNAIKYSGATIIRVSATIENGQLCIVVGDNGVGMSNDELEKIFFRFYRIDTARARATGGSGLGLAISKAIVEAHNGHIDVSSTQGEGSTFSFCIKDY